MWKIAYEADGAVLKTIKAEYEKRPEAERSLTLLKQLLKRKLFLIWDDGQRNPRKRLKTATCN